MYCLFFKLLQTPRQKLNPGQTRVAAGQISATLYIGLSVRAIKENSARFIFIERVLPLSFWPRRRYYWKPGNERVHISSLEPKELKIERKTAWLKAYLPVRNTNLFQHGKRLQVPVCTKLKLPLGNFQCWLSNTKQCWLSNTKSPRCSWYHNALSSLHKFLNYKQLLVQCETLDQ